MLGTIWDQWHQHKHQIDKYQNPSSMQNANLVTRTYEVPTIKTQNNLRQYGDHKCFYKI